MGWIITSIAISVFLSTSINVIIMRKVSEIATKEVKKTEIRIMKNINQK